MAILKAGLRPRLCAAALATACAAAAAPGAALGHGESSPEIRTSIDRIAPALPGVKARILAEGQTRLLMTNDAAVPLEVLAADGTPFLRLGPRGAEANVNSLDWYRTGNAEGVAKPPEEARIGAAPRWVRVGRRPTWAWFDHRLHPEERQAPTDAGPGDTVRLDNWSVPVRQGDRRGRVEGRVDFQALPGVVRPALAPLPPLPAGVTVTLLPGRVPGLFLFNASNRRVTVIGRDGEPFARVSARGAQVNLRSPTYAEDRQARGEPAPARADPRAAPRWRTVADVPRLSWLEGRARYPSGRPPADVVSSGRRTVLTRWSVPLQVEGRRAVVAGTTNWLPGDAPSARPGEQDGGDIPAMALLAGPLLLMLAAGASAAGRARRGRSRPAAP